MVLNKKIVYAYYLRLSTESFCYYWKLIIIIIIYRFFLWGFSYYW